MVYIPTCICVQLEASQVVVRVTKGVWTEDDLSHQICVTVLQLLLLNLFLDHGTTRWQYIAILGPQ